MGFEINMSLCHVCKGLMKILENKTFPIDIRNKQIIFKGDGNQEPDKGSYDLIININPKPDPRFKIINQYDLIYEYNISLIELYTEIKVKLTHLDNKNYLFKYNSRNEGSNKILRMKMIRVRDLGLPINNSGRRGDLYIELNVVFPELSNEMINKLESLKIFNLNKIEIDNNLNDYVEITCELPKIENET
jgi:molecular chaperone DnaJ